MVKAIWKHEHIACKEGDATTKYLEQFCTLPAINAQAINLSFFFIYSESVYIGTSKGRLIFLAHLFDGAMGG